MGGRQYDRPNQEVVQQPPEPEAPEPPAPEPEPEPTPEGA